MLIRSLLGKLLITLALAAGLSSGCGTDEAPPEAQPQGENDGFSTGTFDDLPHPPRSDAVGTRSEKNDVIAQSFEVRNTTPEQVMDFYRENLDGWSLRGDIENTGPGTFRGIWQRDELTLTVSATSAPTLSEGDEVVSQYSLSLATD